MNKRSTRTKDIRQATLMPVLECACMVYSMEFLKCALELGVDCGQL